MKLVVVVVVILDILISGDIGISQQTTTLKEIY